MLFGRDPAGARWQAGACAVPRFSGGFGTLLTFLLTCRLNRALPSSFEEVFEAASAHAAASPPKQGGGSAVGQQRQVQSALISGPEHWRRLLTDVLPAWVQPVRLSRCRLVSLIADVCAR